MKEITIDCVNLENPRALHQALSEALDFPAWYGHNLDALHDMLTSLAEDTALTLLHLDALGRFAMGFRRVMEDSQIENPGFHAIFE